MKLEGTYTAVVTPFTKTGAIDWPAFERILADQLAGGVTGIVPCGTTGESPTLTMDEQRDVIARTVAFARSSASRARRRSSRGSARRARRTPSSSRSARRARARTR